jgi:hypothetical protein
MYGFEELGILLLEMFLTSGRRFQVQLGNTWCLIVTILLISGR